jgi:glycosyltransferase involved in cell wall biosynthesis
MRDSLHRDYGRLRHTRVIPNGCHPDRYHCSPKQPFIFSAGRMWDAAKNLETLSAAAPHLHWPVRVAGLPLAGNASNYQPAAEGMTWLGALTPHQMADTYAEAGIYALPALYEPFGLTVLEAALSGCALVLGDIPTLRENWAGAALFVPPRDVKGLVTATNKLCDDESLRRRLATLATNRARMLTAERMAAAYMRAYRRLLQPVRATAAA